MNGRLSIFWDTVRLEEANNKMSENKSDDLCRADFDAGRGGRAGVFHLEDRQNAVEIG